MLKYLATPGLHKVLVDRLAQAEENFRGAAAASHVTARQLIKVAAVHGGSAAGGTKREGGVSWTELQRFARRVRRGLQTSTSLSNINEARTGKHVALGCGGGEQPIELQEVHGIQGGDIVSERFTSEADFEVFVVAAEEILSLDELTRYEVVVFFISTAEGGRPPTGATALFELARQAAAIGGTGDAGGASMNGASNKSTEYSSSVQNGVESDLGDARSDRVEGQRAVSVSSGESTKTSASTSVAPSATASPWPSGTLYAVVGFGSSEYAANTFCLPAKRLDRWLRQSGAMRLTKLTTIDDALDLEPAINNWMDRYWKAMRWFLDGGGVQTVVDNRKRKLLGGRRGNLEHGEHHPRISDAGTKRADPSSGVNLRNFHNDNNADDDDDDDHVDNDVDVSDESSSAESDHSADDEDGSDDGANAAGNSAIDIEAIGGPADAGQTGGRGTSAMALKGKRKMVTDRHAASLTKAGYKIVGGHSAVKTCRWTKKHARGEGGCYKHSFYGISSMQCMEATPSLTCANKCVFCWRHHQNPVATSWKWDVDDPEFIVEQSLKEHVKLMTQLKDAPGVTPETFEACKRPAHCALSLVGEPIMYPKINQLLGQLHKHEISSFLVTNAQFPDQLETLAPCTQLYLSLDAATPESLKAIDRPLFLDYWERMLKCLDLLRERKERTVLRLTLVKGYNMESEEYAAYGKLIARAMPDFVEIKAVTFAGESSAATIRMQNVPWQEEVIKFCEGVLRSDKEVLAAQYELACEHRHSCSVLIARNKFKKDGKWHTWINYPKFFDLVEMHRKGLTMAVDASDYAVETPPWALWGAKERGFDPSQKMRVRKRASRKTDG